jgi:DNA invertase Pin-like site-specific DNA recombinase
MSTASKAAGYIRRSSAHQEMSIERQKEEILRLSERLSLSIAAWFIDTRSGDSDKRPQFQRMMSLVDSHMREWDTILVFDQSRFSRLDKDDAVRWFVLLRDNDVSLISSIEGIIVDPEAEDDDLGQSLKRDVIQYSKHRYLKDLAQNVASGRFRRGKQGIIGGPVPYGCRRRPDKRFERGPESEIKVLRWMFRCADLG